MKASGCCKTRAASCDFRSSPQAGYSTATADGRPSCACCCRTLRTCCSAESCSSGFRCCSSASGAVPHPEPVNSVTVQSAPLSIVPDPHVAPLQPEPTVVPQATVALPPVIPAPPLHDYSKEIDALFSVPQAPSSPATPQSHPAPASSGPSSRNSRCKLPAFNRSLALCSSRKFLPRRRPGRSLSKPETHVAEVAKKVVEIAHEESKPVLPVRTAAPASLGVDEEVKIPSWLAPLSQNADTPVAESTDSNEASIGQPVSVNSEESYDALVAEAPHRSHSAVFGGQLLGETATPASEVTSTGSKKGLFLGLAAAALLALGGGAWYFQQTHSGPATVAAARSTSVPLSSQAAPASNPPARSGALRFRRATM